MKLKDIQVGHLIVLDDGFTCHPAGVVLVCGTEGNNYSYHFKCDEGDHYLDGQVDRNGDLVGISEYLDKNYEF